MSTQSIVPATSGQKNQFTLPVFVETKLLRPVAEAIIPARTEPFDAARFYQTRTGFYVRETFAESLDLDARQPVNSAPECPYVALLLKVNACDTEIRAELPKWHLSELEDIAGLIFAQCGSGPGFLKQNKYRNNIFYVEGKNSEVVTMRVHWPSSFYQEWVVEDWQPDECRYWDGGAHIFCPGTVRWPGGC